MSYVPCPCNDCLVLPVCNTTVKISSPITKSNEFDQYKITSGYNCKILDRFLNKEHDVYDISIMTMCSILDTWLHEYITHKNQVHTIMLFSNSTTQTSQIHILFLNNKNATRMI